ncbi:thyrotropin-releasing hormone receptor [Elysia marginata]|uniref:Thyrotropin-releasing hormone receptor n=1 Tax=Elysia marginata TaxID=1093978 RepID=A0AAV4F5R8_9GAST|nr:thyrotropin-releasing hormone receptor [Elysia marginata]
METSTALDSTKTQLDPTRLSARDKLLEDINEWLKIYYSMFLITAGTLLNILSILTLSRKSFRRSTTSVYLRFLAVVDLFVLYNGLGRHFISGAFRYNIRHLSEAFCKFNQWTTSFGPDISAWILVAVTGERVLSIVRPHSVRLMCTKFTARVTILGIVLALMATNLPLVFFYGYSQVYDKSTNSTWTKKCILVRSVRFVDEIWYWLDLAKFVLLPSVLLTTSNIVIVSAIARRHRNLSSRLNVRDLSVTSSLDRLAATVAPPSGLRREKAASKSESHPKSVYHVARKHVNLITNTGLRTPGHNTDARSDEISSEHSQFGNRKSCAETESNKLCNARGIKGGKTFAGSSKNRNANSSNSSLTITLVVVNAMFIVCNAPVMVFLLNRDGWFRPDQGAALSLTWTVVVMAMYTNNALNFLFYCATGSRFRAEMRAMFISCHTSSVNISGGVNQRSRFRENSHGSESSEVSTISTSASVIRGASSSIKTSPHTMR